MGLEPTTYWMAIKKLSFRKVPEKACKSAGFFRALQSAMPGDTRGFSKPMANRCELAGDDASSVTLGASARYGAWGDRRGGSLGIHFARYELARGVQRADRQRASTARQSRSTG